MAVTPRHVMESNRRLIDQIIWDLYGDGETSWRKVYSVMCKRQAELNHDYIMQFKFKGVLYHLQDDVPLRSGVRELRPELLDEFLPVYQMFVVDVEQEMILLKNMVAHAIRISKVAEDLIELLPEVMHPSIENSGFFTMDDKEYMSVAQADEFKAMYGEHLESFNTRKLLGGIM